MHLHPSMPMHLELRRAACLLCAFALALILSACSGRDKDEDEDGRQETQAELARIGEVRQAPGITVFVSHLSFNLANYGDLASVAYTVVPRPGTASGALAVSFERSWLDRRRAWDPNGRRLELPVFGLYAAHTNLVDLTARFRDGSKHAWRVEVPTGAYRGPADIYAQPDINVARSATRVPGFDFILVKNGRTAPVVLDTDGNMRWTGAVLADSFSSMFGPDAFYVGSLNTPTLYRMDVGGAYSGVQLGPSPGGSTLTNFHHDLTPGKVGMLAELDALQNGVSILESVLAEIDTEGKVLREWDLGRIFRDHMRAKGDDPSNFVRDGQDWFHMNSAIYNAADNSLLLSSRENFVVKIDYDTGAIRWLFGDTSKHWYKNYPSLRALALRLVEGKAPIGQHTLSITPNGELLLFNNGLGSLNHPPGTSPGATRTFSTPSRYAIDEKAGTAREVWTYEGERKLLSDICSSVYEGSPGNYLVAYSVLNARTKARLLGLDSQGKVAFDFAYPTEACSTVFIAQPLGWTDLKLR
ncbi:aryl-sulfate sulfotransferase [Massilia agri]|uniref:Aryl-sulfate sulfotransferase n=1 Tax=Massilia agri TaxID=1886785 RepID=A0ABT2AL49_9BURK|nr:aryl-sulfate sulfotransferase [Massilia agri]MCS0596977.1 aryl-sulfate sulfotransferase [Massilia agri]